MEKEIRKVKTKAKNAIVKKKRKQRDGGDTPMPNTCRNLFGPSEEDISNVGLILLKTVQLLTLVEPNAKNH
ncbi:hypothetical protein I3842_Q113200 [Carya illinoinensis]|uniref:Uncharacterized protein n=1 Tax=Carya illinoinensis TaxID=32201 RepID=A0A922D047_CARIL|nr:hypothetical protein I3842_Q113200 [Carya illinoinensis]